MLLANGSETTFVSKQRHRVSCKEGRQLEGCPPLRQDLRTEAEEYPLLEAVTRKRLEKTVQAVKDLSCALVTC
jgi:hypothetical protein